MQDKECEVLCHVVWIQITGSVTFSKLIIFRLRFFFKLIFIELQLLCNVVLFSTVSSVQSLSRVRFFVTPRTAARQVSLSITNSQSLLKLMSIEVVMPSNHLIFCHPLLLLPSFFPSIRVFSMSQFFPSDGQSIGVSASTSVLTMNIQDQFPVGWTGWISLLSGLSIVLSNTAVQKHQFFGAQLSLQSNSHIHT